MIKRKFSNLQRWFYLCQTVENSTITKAQKAGSIPAPGLSVVICQTRNYAKGAFKYCRFNVYTEFGVDPLGTGRDTVA
jgi:hypothetical protein